MISSHTSPGAVAGTSPQCPNTSVKVLRWQRILRAAELATHAVSPGGEGVDSQKVSSASYAISPCLKANAKLHIFCEMTKYKL